MIVKAFKVLHCAFCKRVDSSRISLSRSFKYLPLAISSLGLLALKAIVPLLRCHTVCVMTSPPRPPGGVIVFRVIKSPLNSCVCVDGSRHRLAAALSSNIQKQIVGCEDAAPDYISHGCDLFHISRGVHRFFFTFYFVSHFHLLDLFWHQHRCASR